MKKYVILCILVLLVSSVLTALGESSPYGLPCENSWCSGTYTNVGTRLHYFACCLAAGHPSPVEYKERVYNCNVCWDEHTLTTVFDLHEHSDYITLLEYVECPLCGTPNARKLYGTPCYDELYYVEVPHTCQGSK